MQSKERKAKAEANQGNPPQTLDQKRRGLMTQSMEKSLLDSIRRVEQTTNGTFYVLTRFFRNAT